MSIQPSQSSTKATSSDPDAGFDQATAYVRSMLRGQQQKNPMTYGGNDTFLIFRSLGLANAGIRTMMEAKTTKERAEESIKRELFNHWTPARMELMQKLFGPLWPAGMSSESMIRCYQKARVGRKLSLPEQDKIRDSSRILRVECVV